MIINDICENSYDLSYKLENANFNSKFNLSSVQYQFCFSPPTHPPPTGQQMRSFNFYFNSNFNYKFLLNLCLALISPFWWYYLFQRSLKSPYCLIKHEPCKRSQCYTIEPCMQLTATSMLVPILLLRKLYNDCHCSVHSVQYK